MFDGGWEREDHQARVERMKTGKERNFWPVNVLLETAMKKSDDLAPYATILLRRRRHERRGPSDIVKFNEGRVARRRCGSLSHQLWTGNFRNT